MIKTTFVAAFMLALAMGVAQAGEGNGEPFPNTLSGGAVVANQILDDTGTQGMPRLGRAVAQLSTGDLLPANGTQGAVQTANSLPVGAEEGTVTYAQNQSVQRWMLAHQGTTRTAHYAYVGN